MDYSKGNLTVFQEFSFEEILETVDYMEKREEEEYTLKAYEANLLALTGISYSEFRNQVLSESYVQNYKNESSEKTLERVEKIIDLNKWEVRG
ncbi:MAG: hypothetical protein ACI4HO_09090 [Ruminococcus sp.]